MKTVDADYAAEAMLALFKNKPWLTKPGTMSDADAISETEAVMFLRCMATEDVTSYGTTSPSAQRVACSLLLDFMAKVMHQEHPLHKKRWSVDQSKPLHLQALQIIAAEIADNHPQLQSKH